MIEREYILPADEVLDEVHSTREGLSRAEAEKRREQYGPNKLKEAEKITVFQRFLSQLKDPMLIILLVAAGVSAATSILSHESMTDVIIILLVVLLNAILGVFQESKAEAAIEALQTMTAATCKVLRDGKQVVLHSDELVPGDVVILEAGDAVPADGLQNHHVAGYQFIAVQHHLFTVTQYLARGGGHGLQRLDGGLGLALLKDA